MNILQINKFFYLRDGTSRYFINLTELLREKGHKVHIYSMTHPRNFSSSYSDYFVGNVSFDEKNIVNSIKNIPRFFYSFEAKARIKKLLTENKVDLVHIHSIYHHISSSILPEIKKRNIPIIMTAHDYHLIAPNYLLFHDNKICEITKPDQYYKAIFHKCIRNSYVVSFIEVAEKYFNNIVIKEKDFIDVLIVPTHFVKNTFIEYGFPESKIKILPFFTAPNNKIKIKMGKYILYFGGLYKQKGLDFLLEVLKDLPGIPCLIAGEGPEKANLTEIILINKIENVKLLGYQSQLELNDLIAKSQFTIMPSLWFEGFGFVNLEANSMGKPVIAAEIGSIPEVIKHKINGLLFKPGDISDCREKILYLWNNKSLLSKMGSQAHKMVTSDFNPDNHYLKLMKIYRQLL